MADAETAQTGAYGQPPYQPQYVAPGSPADIASSGPAPEFVSPGSPADNAYSAPPSAAAGPGGSYASAHDLLRMEAAKGPPPGYDVNPQNASARAWDAKLRALNQAANAESLNDYQNQHQYGPATQAMISHYQQPQKPNWLAPFLHASPYADPQGQRLAEAAKMEQEAERNAALNAYSREHGAYWQAGGALGSTGRLLQTGELTPEQILYGQKGLVPDGKGGYYSPVAQQNYQKGVDVEGLRNIGRGISGGYQVQAAEAGANRQTTSTTVKESDPQEDAKHLLDVALQSTKDVMGQVHPENIDQYLPHIMAGYLEGRKALAGAGGGAQQAQTHQTRRSGPAGPVYNSADDVKAAVRAGKITTQQATQILKSQFGYKD